jgi:hypothetical protein
MSSPSLAPNSSHPDENEQNINSVKVSSYYLESVTIESGVLIDAEK